ncbi:hypothetical protein [Brenneria populi]|uniref:hypothetical protein n=1 Tax=Brenneria populi TaxID=1505588 RepID=UPI0038992227
MELLFRAVPFTAVQAALKSPAAQAMITVVRSLSGKEEFAQKERSHVRTDMASVRTDLE